MDVLVRIKRLALAGRLQFTAKAEIEMHDDGLSKEDVVEALVTASHIDKTIISTSPYKLHLREKLYIIKSRNFSGTPLYTKGILRSVAAKEIFYVLVSSKRAL